MRGQISSAGVLAGLLLLFSPAAGQEPTRPLTLPEALSLAESADPGLRAALRRSRAAEEDRRASAKFWLPQFSFDADWGRTDVPARVFAQRLNRGRLDPEDMLLANLNRPSADWNLQSSLGLALPIDLSGGLAAGARQAQAGADEERARSEGARGDLHLAVTRTFLGIIVADRAAAAAEKTLQAAKSLEEEMAARVESGATLNADFLRVRTRRRARELSLGRARSDAELLRSRLRSILGWPAGRPVELDAPTPASEDDRDLDGWIARALSSSPELSAAQAGVAGFRAGLRREQRSALPGLRLFAGYQDDRSSLSRGQESTTVELQLHWNVFDFGRSARIAAGRERLEAAGEDSRRASRELRLSVETSWREVQVARLESEAARASRQEADEVFRVTRERWEAGRALLTEVLESESSAASAASDEARGDAAVLAAQAALRRAAGEL